MSHNMTLAVGGNSIPAAKAASKRLGIEFREGQKTQAYYGGAAACEHALHIPGSRYEVGLVRSKTGKGYDLNVDFWGVEGRKISDKLGVNCTLFKQAYGLELAKMQARARGRMVTEVPGRNGIINLQIAA